MTEVTRYLVKRLRERFDNVVAEPVPASWLELLARLDQRERRERLVPVKTAGNRTPREFVFLQQK